MKRVFDLLLLLVSVPITVPVSLVIALVLAMRLGFPIFFTQLRPGLHGKPFRLIKFRSMSSKRDARGELLPDSQRLSSFGVFLRSTSLDELPELWNVLKGEMSLVGPRPLLMEYLQRYSPEQSRRHDVRPGITGWAQINGRNAIGWEARFDLDLWYVDHQSLLLDIRILAITIARVLKREGIASAGEATMRKFTGNDLYKNNAE